MYRLMVDLVNFAHTQHIGSFGLEQSAHIASNVAVASRVQDTKKDEKNAKWTLRISGSPCRASLRLFVGFHDAIVISLYKTIGYFTLNPPFWPDGLI
jgi:1,4-dihydroxy-2-naphthoate octaprenyltransferase